MKEWLIKKLGGATKDEVLTEAVIRLHNTVSVNDILRVENKTVMFGTKSLTTAEYGIIVEQVRSFQKSLLFKILDTDVKYHCNVKMRSARTLQEMETAKVIEFVWDILKTRLSKF